MDAPYWESRLLQVALLHVHYFFGCVLLLHYHQCVRASINKHMEVHETGCGRHGARSSHALFSLDVCVRACVHWSGRVFMHGGRSLEVLPSSEDVSLFNGFLTESFHVRVQSFQWVTADEGVKDQIVAWKRTAAVLRLGH